MSDNREYDNALNGVKVLTICIVVICLSLFAGYCSAHSYPPAPRLTYPVNSFSECAGAILYHFDSLGHDCEATFIDKHPRHIAGHIDGHWFAVTMDAWREYPAMRADELIWLVDEHVAVEAVLARSFEYPAQLTHGNRP